MDIRLPLIRQKSFGLVLLIALSINTISAIAQPTGFPYWKLYRKEYSFGVGLSNFLGDVGGGGGVGTNYLQDFNFGATRWAITGGMRYKIIQQIAVRVSLTVGRVYGNDQLSENEYRNYRNLSFRSNIYEGSLTFEGSLFKENLGHRYKLRTVSGRKAYEIYSYIFAGVGVFNFNPQGYYNGWKDLRPLSTEGQGFYPTRKPYSTTQLCIPLGIGFKYNLDKKWGFMIEYGIRATFTDYIDDVSRTYVDAQLLADYKGEAAAQFADKSDHSIPGRTAAGEQRGNPNNKDSYMFTTVSLTYKIRSKKYGKFIDVPSF